MAALMDHLDKQKEKDSKKLYYIIQLLKYDVRPIAFLLSLFNCLQLFLNLVNCLHNKTIIQDVFLL